MNDPDEIIEDMCAAYNEAIAHRIDEVVSGGEVLISISDGAQNLAMRSAASVLLDAIRAKFDPLQVRVET